MDVVLYRFYRLRRLVVVSLLPPLAVLAIAALFRGPGVWLLTPLAFLPVAHLLRFPNVWIETMTVSVTMAVVLALSATVGADISLLGLVIRIGGLAVLAFLVFLVLAHLSNFLIGRGPEKDVSLQASRRSRLDAARLMAAIVPAPDRDEGLITSGPADPDGVFEVIYHHRHGAFQGAETVATPVTMMQLITDRSDHHAEVLSISTDGGDEAMARFDFAPAGTGCRVTYTEPSMRLTMDQRFGMWLTDYLADYLTDLVDRAEGRAMRANRFQLHDQLVVHIARRIGKGMGPPPGADPDIADL